MIEFRERINVSRDTLHTYIDNYIKVNEDLLGRILTRDEKLLKDYPDWFTKKSIHKFTKYVDGMKYTNLDELTDYELGEFIETNEVDVGDIYFDLDEGYWYKVTYEKE